jgi:hypothetical protein
VTSVGRWLLRAAVAGVLLVAGATTVAAVSGSLRDDPGVATAAERPIDVGFVKPPPEARVDCPLQKRPFGPGNWPSACWRPYAPSSPFNSELGDSPTVHADSDRMVSRMLGFGEIQHLLAGQADTAKDYAHPTYWSQPDDPWFTLHCVRAKWGRCPIEGERIQVPDEAIVPGGSDGHVTVVDQRTGWEHDLWRVKEIPEGGGTLSFAWGGKTRIDGDGLNAQGNAAGFGEMAGLIRIEELEAAHIDHALFLSINCDSGGFVYPAEQNGRSCSRIGEPNDGAPPMGTRFQLDMSEAEIDALDAPDWKKAILRAMARYGMYVGDTGGTWALKDEGGITYTSFGYEDRWAEFAKKEGLPRNGPYWVFNIRDGVDWESRLRAIDPCEAEGTC